MEKAVGPKGKFFKSFLSLKHFPLRSKENSFTKAFSINCLKDKSVYKVTKNFPLTSMADSHNSVPTLLQRTKFFFIK